MLFCLLYCCQKQTCLLFLKVRERKLDQKWALQPVIWAFVLVQNIDRLAG